MNVGRVLSVLNVSGLLSAASLCAALAGPAAAQGQQARTAAVGAPAANGARAAWRDVRIEFEGNRLFTSERLRGMTTECYERTRRIDEELDPEAFDYCLRTEVLGFVRRSGYLRARLGELRAERSGAGETLTVPLDEKELYRLGRVRIEGAETFAPERLRELLPLRQGDVADGPAVVRWLGEHLRGMYADEGFIQYEYDVEPEFRLDTGAGEGVADFSVTINEGRRFKLRRLSFASRGDVPEDVLRGAMLLREGDFFSAQKFGDSVQRLNDLDLFDHINQHRDADFQADEETGELDIRIRLTRNDRVQTPPAARPVPPPGGGQSGQPRLAPRL